MRCQAVGLLCSGGSLAPCDNQAVPACLPGPGSLPSPCLQVDLLSATTAPANKALAIFWGACGFAAALALHVLQPG